VWRSLPLGVEVAAGGLGFGESFLFCGLYESILFYSNFFSTFLKKNPELGLKLTD
jgi:hypothetical protein